MGLVEQLLQVTPGDAFQMPAQETICVCTDPSLEDTRRLIRSHRLQSQRAVWQELGWKTHNGCRSCRPAVNCYLLANWPIKHQVDPHCRSVNKRKHANILNDGAFSVVLRMWVGITNPAERAPSPMPLTSTMYPLAR